MSEFEQALDELIRHAHSVGRRTMLDKPWPVPDGGLSPAQLQDEARLRVVALYEAAIRFGTDERATLMHQVRIVALEDAARVCDSISHDNPMTARDCADAIRALEPK